MGQKLRKAQTSSHKPGLCSIQYILYKVWILSYCVIELPTAENIFVELDPMSRTVTTTSRITTANMTAYSATS